MFSRIDIQLSFIRNCKIFNYIRLEVNFHGRQDVENQEGCFIRFRFFVLSGELNRIIKGR